MIAVVTLVRNRKITYVTQDIKLVAIPPRYVSTFDRHITLNSLCTHYLP